MLALLPTDLTLRELAGMLYVSLNTVKSQTWAIYRKLDVTSRGEAVLRARALGLAVGAGGGVAGSDGCHGVTPI